MNVRPIAYAVSWAFAPFPCGHFAAHWIWMSSPSRDQMRAFIRFQLDRIAERECAQRAMDIMRGVL